MALPKESADALRLCVRILIKKGTRSKPETLARNVESLIRSGRWPVWRVDDLPPLWFPNDPQKANRLEKVFNEAFESGALPRRDKNVLFVSDFTSWVECPALPKDSPLIHWLPEWMQSLKPLQGDRGPKAENPGKGWEEEARLVANTYWKRHKANDLHPSLRDVSDHVANELRKRGIEGPNGPLSGPYIKRRALQGDKWWRGKRGNS